MNDSITISVPVYNEEENLEDIVKESVKVMTGIPDKEFEILIINDGSTDKTKEIAERLCKEDRRIRLVNHNKNLGFAEAQKSCLKNAKKAWVFLMPADGQVDIREISEFLLYIENSDLILGIPHIRNDNFFRVLMSRFYYFIVHLLFGLNFKNYSICLMIRKSLFDKIKINSNSPVALTELLVKALLIGAKVSEVNIIHLPRKKGYSKSFKSYFSIPYILYDLFRLYRFYIVEKNYKNNRNKSKVMFLRNG